MTPNGCAVRVKEEEGDGVDRRASRKPKKLRSAAYTSDDCSFLLAFVLSFLEFIPTKNKNSKLPHIYPRSRASARLVVSALGILRRRQNPSSLSAVSFDLYFSVSFSHFYHPDPLQGCPTPSTNEHNERRLGAPPPPQQAPVARSSRILPPRRPLHYYKGGGTSTTKMSSSVP